MDLRDQLQTTLSDKYTIERELGGGGMSRVFVADELRLGRKVVVKVLSPELAAGLSAERFEREIRVAASLQQANIVPVLAAGDTNGLPYYSMPYVEGESLRARLASGPLPVKDVLRILGDVARALAYAHERGIVHRDIKPDNVLLSGGTAVVTDFGIAKAISASRTQSGNATLTQLGTSLGTPAYMSPEQAVGDPDIDQRADIYAFGCMAYELLAGHPPFSGRTPQRVLAAHVNEEPQNVAEFRADAPASLCELTMRCLAKDAPARPQSAAEIVAVLDASASSGAGEALPPILIGGPRVLRRVLLMYLAAVIVVAVLAKAAIVVIGLPDWVFPGALIAMALGLPAILFTAYAQRVTHRLLVATPKFTPGGTASVAPQGTMATIAVRASPHLSWRRTTFAVASVVGAFVAVVGVFMLLRALGIGPSASLLAAGRLPTRAPVIIADFRTSRADTSVGTVVTEAVRANLAQSSSITLIPPTSVAGTLRRMQLAPTTPVTTDIARQIAAREGVKAVVDGDVTGLGSGYVINVRLISADSATVLASYQATVDGPKELIDGVDRLARKLRGKIGESMKSVQASPPLARVTTSSLEALKLYTEGSRAHDVAADYRTAVPLLRRAVAIDSNFAMAWRKLAAALRNDGSPIASDSAIEHAFRLRSRLNDEERYLTEGYYYTSGPGLDRRKAIAAYQAVLDLGDSSYVALNNLALVYSSLRQRARAESLYKLAARRDSSTLLARTNLMNVLWDEGKMAEANALAVELLRRQPKNPAAVGRALQAAYLNGDTATALRMVDSILKTKDSPARAMATNFRGAYEMLHGQIRAAERDLFAPDSATTPNSPKAINRALVMTFDDVFFRHDSARAVMRLDSLAASPAIAQLPRTNSFRAAIAQGYADVGRPDRARPILVQFTAALKDSVEILRAWPMMHTLMADVALAEKRPRDAIVQTRMSDSLPDGPASNVPVSTLLGLARAFDLAGQSDSAVVMLEKFISTPSGSRMQIDARFMAATQKRLGELYESRGDRVKAASHYAQFVSLWQRADPELQPSVQDVKRRLSRLSDSERK